MRTITSTLSKYSAVKKEKKMIHKSIKTYGNDRGFSCAFRQALADSHCNLIHGYSLGFRFVFEAAQLDDRNWVVDFGCFKRNGVKDWFKHMFDHTTVVAADDPELSRFEEMDEKVKEIFNFGVSDE